MNEQVLRNGLDKNATSRLRPIHSFRQPIGSKEMQAFPDVQTVIISNMVGRSRRLHPEPHNRVHQVGVLCIAVRVDALLAVGH